MRDLKSEYTSYREDRRCKLVDFPWFYFKYYIAFTILIFLVLEYTFELSTSFIVTLSYY